MSIKAVWSLVTWMEKRAWMLCVCVCIFSFCHAIWHFSLFAFDVWRSYPKHFLLFISDIVLLSQCSDDTRRLQAIASRSLILMPIKSRDDCERKSGIFLFPDHASDSHEFVRIDDDGDNDGTTHTHLAYVYTFAIWIFRKFFFRIEDTKKKLRKLVFILFWTIFDNFSNGVPT